LSGNLTSGILADMIWNWDNKLRAAAAGADSIQCRYGPGGEMLYKETVQGSTTVQRKFIVDVTGEYPVILMEIDPADSTIEKSYLCFNGQTLIQYDGSMAGTNVAKYFYLHDRLGSVRTVIDEDGDVKNLYSYDPFGNHLEQAETIDNRFRFAGYKYDQLTGNYNCNARWYDPQLYRFTGRDPITGSFKEPLTLHAYLYCLNEPVNYVDVKGNVPTPPAWDEGNNRWIFYDRHYDEFETQQIISDATELVGTGILWGPLMAHRGGGLYDYKDTKSTFQLDHSTVLEDSEFGNYLAGYTTFYNYGPFGEACNRGAGHAYAFSDFLEGRSAWPIDDFGSSFILLLVRLTLTVPKMVAKDCLGKLMTSGLG
jgi:RHS repeat-associated protein